jgi:hypothetical protein
MSQSTSPNAAPRERSPVRNPSSPQMRAVRKELLLLRAEVERADFVRARVELRTSLERFGWLKLFLPRFSSVRTKGSGKSVSDWLNHPLVGSLASLLLAKPLRSTLAAGAKPLLKWGTLGAVAWAGFRLLARTIRREHGGSEASNG